MVKKFGAYLTGALALGLVTCLGVKWGTRPPQQNALQDSMAAVAVIEQLLNDLGSHKTTMAIADSIDLGVRRESGTPRSNSATNSVEVLRRQSQNLRKDAQLRSATHAAVKSYVESLRKSIAGLPTSAPFTVVAVADALRPFAWPFTALALMILLLWHPTRFNALVGRIRSIRLFNSEVTLGEQTTRAAESTFLELRTQATSRFRHLATRKRIPDTFAQMMDEKIIGIVEGIAGTSTGLRATLYVEDILFERFLTQLVDYWPSGGGRGRAFPIYFGIIGKAWRLGRTVIQGDVPTEKERLILDWGMTADEARKKGKDRKSFAAIVLKSEAHQVAILYLDCEPGGAFGEKDSAAGSTEFENKVQKACEESGLVSALASLTEEARIGADPISLVSQDGR